MPITSVETVTVALREAQVNRWKIASWTVDHSGSSDIIMLTLHIGEADAEGHVALYQFWKTVKIEGVALGVMMAAAGQKTHDRVEAEEPPALAQYLGIKEALYEACQTLGEVPAGDLE